MTDPITSRTDPSRTVREFDPHACQDLQLTVGGLGSVGSAIAFLLGKMGVFNLQGFDFDKVEAANVGNQMYLPTQVGMSKAAACREMVNVTSGIKMTTHEEKIVAATKLRLSGVVFLALDGNNKRQPVWQDCLRLNPRVKYVIDTRVAVGKYVVYGFNPCDMDDVLAWERYWSPDEPLQPNECRDPTNTGVTAFMAACEAVERFKTWYHVNVAGRDYDPPKTASGSIDSSTAHCNRNYY